MASSRQPAFTLFLSPHLQDSPSAGSCSQVLGTSPSLVNRSLQAHGRRVWSTVGGIVRSTMISRQEFPGRKKETERDSVPDVYFATCARGLGEFLRREIESEEVKGEVLDVASSGVRFLSTEPGHVTGYRACIWLRTAMRVLLEVSSRQLQPATSSGSYSSYDLPGAIYDFIKDAADWSFLLGSGSKSFSIQVRVSEDTRGRRQQFSRRTHGGRRAGREKTSKVAGLSPGEHTVQVRAKDAICDALRDAGMRKPPKPTSHADSDVPLFITLHGAAITLYLDMAGASLHKRGYRGGGAMHKSSLNESVAAGMLYMAGFQPDGSLRSTPRNATPPENARRPLVIVDPMCGSGTLLIEAALLRLRVAVGLYRGKFAFQAWADFDAEAFQGVMNEAVNVQREDEDVMAIFIGNDINPRALALARRDLERTRLTGLISLHHGDARELALPAAPTLTISNPPWGLRLGGEITAWEGLGQFLREYATGCVAVFLSGDAWVTRGLRMKARKKMPVRIGNVDTRVLIYDVLPKLKEKEAGDGSGRGKDGYGQSGGRRPRPLRLQEREMPIL